MVAVVLVGFDDRMAERIGIAAVFPSLALIPIKDILIYPLRKNVGKVICTWPTGNGCIKSSATVAGYPATLTGISPP